MGQRLTVDILDNGERIAVVYYHWSAYFSSTIAELKLLKDDIISSKKENKDILLAIIDGLELRGGGLDISSKTRSVAKKMWPQRTFKTDINRNFGLICLDESDINETEAMSEGMAWIDISSEEATSDVELEDAVRIDKSKLPYDPFDIMSFHQLEEVYDCVEKLYEEAFEELKRKDICKNEILF